jgi:EAL domain-containing protein (putative c-di-GMP-specific phosphodiesterase class I)
MGRTKRRAARSDVLLILDRDPVSLSALLQVASDLGCDVIEADSLDGLRNLLLVRVPTMIALSVDHSIGNDTEVVDILAALPDQPATLLIGSVRPRVLASAARSAEAHGLRIVATTHRPLDVNATARLLAPHLRTLPPIDKREFERAFSEFELTLQYQPKLAIGGDAPRIQAVEALVRWHHPRRGVLHPAAFLGAVELHGQMTRLTDYVLAEALRQAGQWSEHGLVPEMIVNLSPRLVRDRGFPDRLALLLRENAVPPNRFSLDVTEAAESADRDLMLEVFTRLRILGVGLCLDNFGSGLSSLTDLYRMPFSEIKIDHTLIADVVREKEAQLIVGAIADLAHTLRLNVCAAGVETREVHEYLRGAGFDMAQGNYYSAPLEAGEVESLMRSWPRADSRASGRWRLDSAPPPNRPAQFPVAVGEDPPRGRNTPS